MNHEPLATTLGLGLVAFVALACDPRSGGTGPAASVSPGATVARARPCRPARGTKLGQPFVRVCPDPESEPGAAPFFIHAAPIPCAPGDHDELSCPPVTPLQGARAWPGEPRILPMLAAVVDAAVAHRLCTMRFAGRLPTRRELERARRTLGLATVAVEEGGQPAGSHVAFRRMPDWATEVSCEQPSLLGPECGAAPLPMEAAARLDWPHLRSCTAVPSGDAALPLLGIGEACPARGGGSSAPGTPLPCRVRLDAEASIASGVEGFALLCGTTGVGAPRPLADPTGQATVRCVVPESLLDVRPNE